MENDDAHLPDLSDYEFKIIARTLHERSGIKLDESKKSMVRSRLLSRLNATKSLSFSQYCALLDARPEAEGIYFCNALTTNLTSFFREPHHFWHLQSEFARAEKNRRREFRVWSAACSTGEEAYSAAMAIGGNLHAARTLPKILATDINTSVLKSGQKGHYPDSAQRLIPAEYRMQCEVRTETSELVIGPNVRKLVEFRHLNLQESWSLDEKFDAIFCRNVLIYFEASVQSRIVDRLVASLEPGGILYLGHSEMHLGDHPSLTSEGKTIYRGQ